MKKALRFILLFLLCTVGISAMGEVVSNTEYSTKTTATLPEGWTGKGGGTSYIQLTDNSCYIQTDTFSVGKFESITIKARKFGGPSDDQALISIIWIDAATKAETTIGTVTPTSTTLSNYTVTSIKNPQNSTKGYVKVACLRASSSKGSGVSNITFTFSSPGVSTVSTPYFTLAEGTYTGSQTVEIKTETKGATIVYTLDNSTPLKTSAVYTGPLTISKSTTVKAMAIKSGMENSEVASATYTITAENTATYTIKSTSSVTESGKIPEGTSATYASTYGNKCQLTNGNSMTLTLSGYAGYKIKNITLSMHSNTDKGAGTFIAKAGTTTLAEISEATTFKDWFSNKAFSTEYIDVPVTMTNDNYTIQANENVVITIAATTNSLFCQSFSIEYEKSSSTIEKVAAPVITPEGGTFNTAQTVEMSTTTSGATIYYTTDGSQPTTNDNMYYQPINISKTTTLKAIAIKEGMTNSDVTTASFTINNQGETDYATTYTSNITLSAAEGTSTTNSTVSIKGNTYTAVKAGTSSIAGAVKVTVPAGTTTLHLHAAAWNKENVTLNITGATCTPNTLTLTSDSGISGNGNPYTISDNASSYYYQLALSGITTDTQLTFTAASGKRFVIWGVNAIGAGGLEQVAAPTITPESGTYNSAQTVEISTTTTGANIYYTLDGSQPTAESTPYSGSFTVSSTTTIKAIAVKAGMTSSNTTSATISIQSGDAPQWYFDFANAQPANWPNTSATSVAGEQTYTLDNVSYKFSLTKTEGTNGIYASGTSGNYYLMATKGNSIGLPVVQGKKLTKIEIGNTAGCSASTSIHISHVAGGEAISGGEEQTWKNKGSLYEYNLNDADDETRYYIVVEDANAQIAYISLTYVEGDGIKRVAAPTFSPEGGTYSNIINIGIYSDTPNATIYYTLDGSTPNPNNVNSEGATRQYLSPISTSQNRTITAIAVKTGMKSSYLSSASYKFANQYESLAALVADGEPTAEGEMVKVTLTNDEIASFYTSGSYRNGVRINVGEKSVLIYCKNVPETWQAGGLLSGTIECTWKLYGTEWELMPTSWSDFTYTPVGAHDITIDSNIQHGTVTANYTSAAQGTMILLTVTPDEGYQLVKGSLKATTIEGADVDVASNAFVMPAIGVIITAQFEEKATSTYDTTYDFTKIEGFDEWATQYAKHIVEYKTATVTFENADKNSQTIKDRPVTKGKSVTIQIKDNKTITGVRFEFKQWGSNTQAATLHYSTDGGETFEETETTVNLFSQNALPCTIESELPTGTNAVKVTFSNTKQIGITSASVNFASSSDVNTAKMKIGTAKWATFYSQFAVDVPANVYAYMVTLDANQNARRVKLGGDTAYTLPAETPVMIYSDTEGGIDITYTEGESTGEPVAVPNTRNYLIGTEVELKPMPTTTEGNVNYILQKKASAETANWYLVVEDKNSLPANRAYLSVPSTANIKELMSEDYETSITSLAREAKAATGIYNIAGQKVQPSYKGLIIINGKKYINK